MCTRTTTKATLANPFCGSLRIGGAEAAIVVGAGIEAASTVGEGIAAMAHNYHKSWMQFA